MASRYLKLASTTLRSALSAKHLKRVEWDEHQFPMRLYPFMTTESLSSDKVIAIDADIAFGRPVVLRAGVSTPVIADRIDAGEKVRERSGTGVPCIRRFPSLQ